MRYLPSVKVISGVGQLWILLAAIAFVGLVNLWLGLSHGELLGIVGGGLGLTFAAIRGVRRVRRARLEAVQTDSPSTPAESSAADVCEDDEPSTKGHKSAGSDLGNLIEEMLSHGRFALLLRPQIACQLNRAQLDRAIAALENDMALVPDGEVVLECFGAAPDDDADAPEDDNLRGSVVEVPRVFLDRYPVTNRQFWHFVKAGGYRQMALWDPEIWPAVLDFVDRTGEPGPRQWQQGRYPRGEDNHPVTGISWYEAAAYARWVGKRLPTDPEWVKASSWPVVLSPTTRMQRRYPWGDSMDRKRANLWGSGPGHPVSVYEYADGVSVGGIHHLIGNVWEWTSSDFDPDCRDMQLILPGTMRSLRGGAFDTYFDGHATCQFATGDNPVIRKRNIGFRCAVSACDLSLFESALGSLEPHAVDSRTHADGSGTQPGSAPARVANDNSVLEEMTA